MTSRNTIPVKVPLRPPTNQARRINVGVNRNQFNGGPPGGGGGNDDFVEFVGYESKNTVGQKVTNSLAGLFVGPVMIFFACLLLWQNESWGIKTHRSLEAALRAHVEIPDASAPIMSDYKDKMVHVAGTIACGQAAPIADSYFDLTRPNAISLTRHVEIYQWVEKVKQERRQMSNGDTEVYETTSYRKEWVPQPVSSQSFRHPYGHENVGHLPLGQETQNCHNVQLGAYTLGNVLTKQIRDHREVPLSAVKALPPGAARSGNVIDWPLRVRGGSTAAELNDGVEEKRVRIDGQEKIMYIVTVTGDSFSSKKRALEAAGNSMLTTASNSVIRASEIGDIRIRFTEVPCTFVSVMAQLTGHNMLTNWPSQHQGYDVAILVQGAATARDMILSQQASNKAKTWLFRAGGLFLNIMGFSMITSIVSTTADIGLNWIPLLGPMTTSLINLGLSVANAIMGSSLTLVVAAIAWIFYRPFLGSSMLVGALGLFYTASRAGGEGIRMGRTFAKME